MTYYIAKMEDKYLKVYHLDKVIDFERSLQPFSVKGLSGDYTDFFIYGKDIVSKNEDKLRSFVSFRNRLCT